MVFCAKKKRFTMERGIPSLVTLHRCSKTKTTKNILRGSPGLCLPLPFGTAPPLSRSWPRLSRLGPAWGGADPYCSSLVFKNFFLVFVCLSSPGNCHGENHIGRVQFHTLEAHVLRCYCPILVMELVANWSWHTDLLLPCLVWPYSCAAIWLDSIVPAKGVQH